MGGSLSNIRIMALIMLLWLWAYGCTGLWIRACSLLVYLRISRTRVLLMWKGFWSSWRFLVLVSGLPAWFSQRWLNRNIVFVSFFWGGGCMLMKGWLIWCQAPCDGLNCVCRRCGPGQSWLLLPFPAATAAAALRKFDFRSSETHGSPFLSAAWLPFSLRVHKWFFIGWNLRRIG